MKKLATAVFIVLPLFFFSLPDAMACECESKTILDVLDWNESGTILHARILDATMESGSGHLVFTPIEVYKGIHPGEEVTIAYSADEGHSIAHDLQDIQKDQEWILFIDKNKVGYDLGESKTKGFCALSRQVMNGEDDKNLKFIAEMKKYENGQAKLYHSNGNIRAEGKYNRGVPTGRWTYYGESGQVSESGGYITGKRNGAWNSYGLNEETGVTYVSAMNQYVLGRVYISEQYNSSGMLTIQDRYTTGEHETNFYDEDGHLQTNIMAVPSKKSSVVVQYFPGGQVKEIAVIDNGQYLKRTFYDSNGDLTEDPVSAEVLR